MTNVKSNENVVCWNCQHFQRYDESDTPTACIGECRFKPIGCYKSGEETTNGTNPLYRANNFAVVKDGSQMWCGNFERSLEKNLPPMPPHNDDSCNAQYTLPDDWQNFQNSRWNKQLKTGYVSTPSKGSVCCWNCDHFNPKDASSEPSSRSGTCRRDPPCPYETGDNPNSYWMCGEFPSMPDAVCNWCSQWERARHTIAAPYAGYVCVQSHLLESEAGGSTIAAVSTATAKKTAKKTK